MSEQLAVQSITQTLGANVAGIRQLKILIHGQEAETLAGHLDLYGLFPVASLTPVAAPPSASVLPLLLLRPKQRQRSKSHAIPIFVGHGFSRAVTVIRSTRL